MNNLVKYVVTLLVDKPTMLLSVFIVVSAIGLTVFHYFLKKRNKNLRFWRFLCLAPLLASGIHFIFYHFRGGISYTLALYGASYLAALLIALWQFFYKKKTAYRVMAVIVNLCAAVSALVIISVLSSYFVLVHNFSGMGYVEAFEASVKAMRENYVLSEWKEIDYDGLEADIRPMVEQAQSDKDEAAYGIALLTYCYRFYDGHVILAMGDDACMEEIKIRLAGNDYGLSMITLDSGETMAVLVEDMGEAAAAGIHEGTLIVGWNGMPIDEAKQDVECIYPELMAFPVADNEAYFKAIFLAGRGGDENEVTFIDDNGTEQTVTLKSIGSYRQRMESAIGLFYHTDIPDENFSCRMLSEDCGYMRINAESTGWLMDARRSLTGDNSDIVEMLDKKLGELRESGMTKLVIDLRNNEGGSDEICVAAASLFSEEKFFNHAVAAYEKGEYRILQESYVVPGGKYADIEVAVLVNGACASAGDGMADTLSRLPNVTLMGITTSNGVDQSIGGWCFTTGSTFIIAYPYMLTLDEDGQPRIDTRADRISRIPPDVHIELTAKAAEAIFGGEEDFELSYAVEYLKGK